MKEYYEDVDYVLNRQLPWQKLKNKIVMISGASGMVGSFLIDVLMRKNINIKIIALGRNEVAAKERFIRYWEDPCFKFIAGDINEPVSCQETADFIIHAASNTHPIAYASDPIGTIMTNVLGTYNILEYASKCHAEVLFMSSVEVYGENRGDKVYFDEQYSGYINCNTLRAGYPESKRAGEALCQAFIKKNNIKIVIARLARIYGSTMLWTDTKAISQFIKNGIAKEDIVLKSAGSQFYSYIYVVDAVAAILTILLRGESGQAYNVADKDSDISLKDLAQLIADLVDVKVVHENPDVNESIGYSKATRAVLDSKKLKDIGWIANWEIKSGLERTIDILLRVKKHTLYSIEML